MIVFHTGKQHPISSILNSICKGKKSRKPRKQRTSSSRQLGRNPPPVASTTAPPSGQGYELRFDSPTGSFSQGTILKLVKSLVGSYYGYRCWVHSRKVGNHAQIIIVKFFSGAKVVLKIPSSGTPGIWTAKEAALLHSEAMTMRYINEVCEGALVPLTLAHDTSCRNAVGAPYILMDCMEGMPLTNMWPRRYGVENFEELRANVLRSLAKAMADIRQAQFFGIGMPWFNYSDCSDARVLDLPRAELEMVPYHIRRGHSVLSDPPPRSAYAYLRKHLDQMFDGLPNLPFYRSRKLFLELYLDCLPFSYLSKQFEGVETFGVTPPDFDMDNILVDSEGNVTAILGWRGVETRPQYLSWAAVPKWLRGDYHASYCWPYAGSYPSYELERYRQMYVEAMKVALIGNDDWRYTQLSATACALQDVLYEGSDVVHFCDILLEAVLPRVNQAAFYDQLFHKGWVSSNFENSADQVLQRMRDLFFPDLYFHEDDTLEPDEKHHSHTRLRKGTSRSWSSTDGQQSTYVGSSPTVKSDTLWSRPHRKHHSESRVSTYKSAQSSPQTRSPPHAQSSPQGRRQTASPVSVLSPVPSPDPTADQAPEAPVGEALNHLESGGVAVTGRAKVVTITKLSPPSK